MEKIIWNDIDSKTQDEYLKRPSFKNGKNINDVVSNILDDIKKLGDEAVQKYTQKFDQVDLESLCVKQDQTPLDPETCAAIDLAYSNIHKFHEQQGFHPYTVETMSGVQCERIIRPIARVGLYVPGGTAPLISTTLMLGIPAQIAGCSQITLCTPCDQNGQINPYILYAAKLCGIDRIFRIGGAQAIGAMAYGTETVPKSDKIFGPGNAFVTEAKIQVTKDPFGAGIDMPAGPSEVCVIVNDTSDPIFVAADLLSQAEHDTLSQVLLIGLSDNQINAIQTEIEKQLQTLPRKNIAERALKNSRAIIAKDMEQAIHISNHYAPEHLILCFEDAHEYIDNIQNAGSIFVGPWTPESIGDYASGTNHVLPTYGYARCYSGLSVESFQKTMTVQELSKQGLKTLGPTVEKLALLENLDAHARAISHRVNNFGK